jgi:NitT/TauT family transport system permease protein
MNSRMASPLGHVTVIGLFLVGWEYAAYSGLMDPTFFGRPSGIALYLWNGFVASDTLWTELGFTVAGAGISFVLGSICAIATGLVFASFPRIHRAAEPYLTLLNAMPRIALKKTPTDQG